MKRVGECRTRGDFLLREKGGDGEEDGFGGGGWVGEGNGLGGGEEGSENVWDGYIYIYMEGRRGKRILGPFFFLLFLFFGILDPFFLLFLFFRIFFFFFSLCF